MEAKTKGGNFNWTNECVKVLFNLCMAFNAKHGKKSGYNWKEIQEEFEKETKTKCHNPSCCKNKLDSMKRDWKAWKTLKRGETGLGWDPTTLRISASDEWWSKKIAEDGDCKKFRNKPVSVELEEMWTKLSEDTVATGKNCVAPSMDSANVNETEGINLENSYVLETDNMATYGHAGNYDCSQFTSSRLEDLEKEENDFFSKFMNEMSHGGIPTSSQSTGNDSKNIPQKSKQMKLKRRQSPGGAMFQKHMADMSATCARALEILEVDSSTTVNKNEGGVASALEVLDRLVDDGSIEMGGDIWCYAVTLLEDVRTTKIFMRLRDDSARLAWLKWKLQNK